MRPKFPSSSPLSIDNYPLSIASPSLRASAPLREKSLSGLCLLLSQFLLLLIAPSCQAYTVTGIVHNTLQVPVATNVTFTPLSTPLSSPPNVIYGTTQTVYSDTNGAYSINLQGGNYRTTIGTSPRDSFVIAVPTGSGTNSINALITSRLTYQYPTSPVYEEKINKGVASGYPSLNSSGLIPSTQLGTGTPSASTYLSGAGTWTTPAGSGGGVTQIGLTSSNLSVTGSPSTNLDVSLPQLVPAGTGTKVAFDGTGRITGTNALTDADIPVELERVLAAAGRTNEVVRYLQAWVSNKPWTNALIYGLSTGVKTWDLPDPYQVLKTDNTVIYTYNTDPGTVYLPDEASENLGRWLTFVNASTFTLSIKVVDRFIIAPDLSGSGTDTVILPAGRTITLLRSENDIWRQIGFDWHPSLTNGLLAAHQILPGTNITITTSNGLPIINSTASSGGSGVATNTSLGVFEGTLTNGQVISISTYQIQYFTNNAPTNNLSLSFTNAIVGRPCQIYITGIATNAITNISYTWPGEARWFSWTNTYVSTNKVLLLSITPIRTNLVHVVGKEDAR